MGLRIQAMFIMNDFFFTKARLPKWSKAALLSRIYYYTQTHHTGYDSFGRVTSPRQRPLPDTQQSQQRDIHVPDRIRTHNPSKRAAADPRLRKHHHSDRPCMIRVTEYRMIRRGNIVLLEEVGIFKIGSEQIPVAASSRTKINELLGPK